MEKLKLANLYKAELIPVSGKLVDRYNKCLKLMGVAPSGLKTFSIDGMGWSPEIADEKGDVNYLNHGDANQHAIIITPLQKNKPIYVPFHTFDREMMRLVFDTYGEKIKDITRDCAICIDFDQKIEVFYEPLDVLKYNRIKICFHLINNLNEAQKHQLKLIDTFHQGNNFIDEGLHAQLLASAQQYGDLRDRDLDLPALEFTASSFYTRAFGGVYVLRDFIMPIVVFKDKASHNAAVKNTTHNVLIYHVDHSELIVKLREHLIIDYNLRKVVETKRYERIKKLQLALQLEEAAHPKKEILNNTVLFKNYLNKIDKEHHKLINGVEQYLEKTSFNNTPKIPDLIDEKVFVALHEPHSSLSEQHHDLIWRLLVTIAPKDVLYVYWYDKEAFYKIYESWDDSLQEWAIETISSELFNP